MQPCPNCGRPLPNGDSLTCPACGAILPPSSIAHAADATAREVEDAAKALGERFDAIVSDPLANVSAPAAENAETAPAPVPDLVDPTPPAPIVPPTIVAGAVNAVPPPSFNPPPVQPVPPQPPPAYGSMPPPPPPPSGMPYGSQRAPKRRTSALLLELLPGLFLGLMGIGWLYAGKTGPGIGLLIGSIAWWGFMVVLLVLTLGIGCLCFPLVWVAVGLSSYLLNQQLKAEPQTFG